MAHPVPIWPGSARHLTCSVQWTADHCRLPAVASCLCQSVNIHSTTKPTPSVIHYLAQGISYPPKLITGAYSCMAGLCFWRFFYLIAFSKYWGQNKVTYQNSSPCWSKGNLGLNKSIPTSEIYLNNKQEMESLIFGMVMVHRPFFVETASASG